METVNLGRSGLKVSRLCLATMIWIDRHSHTGLVPCFSCYCLISGATPTTR
jgi:hypothetical protein